MIEVSPFFAKIRNLFLAVFALSVVGFSVATDFIFRHEITRQARIELVERGLDVSVNGIIQAIRQGKLALLENYDTAGISFGQADAEGMTPLHAAIIERDKEAIDQVFLRQKQVRKVVDVPTRGDGMTPLKRALNAGDFHLANRLIDQLGADVNTDREPGLPYLIDAIQRGDEELRDYLLDKNVDVNRKGVQTHCALALAAAEDNLDLMRRLVAQGARIDAVGVSGKPLLLEAVEENGFEEAAFLLEKGADVNVMHEGTDALLVALDRQDGRLKGLVLGFGAKVDRPGRSGEHLIFEAYESGNHDWLMYLLDAGVAVDTRSTHGDTLLLAAVKAGDYQTMDHLIARRANLDLEDAEGLSPLAYAVGVGDTASVRTLVEQGAMIYPESMVATAYHRRDNPTLNLFMNAGVDPGIVLEGTDRRVLDVAVAEGAVETVRTLLNAGADIGDNLWAALLTGQDDLVEVILANGADPSQAGLEGETPVEYVLNTGRHTLLEPLLEAGADPNPMYDATESWVSRALREGDEDTALALVKAGASLGDGFASDGHSLLGWSIAHEMEEVSLALIEAGVDVNVVEPNPAKSDFIEKFDESSTFRRALRYDRRIRPLMMVAVKRNHRVAQAMVNAGAKNHATPKYLYPIAIASWYADVRMMQIIYGRDPDHQPRKIVVDLSSQRVTLYENGEATYSSICSTGKSGYRTPAGSYVITQKARHHTSSIYGSSMPYFMRLSCSAFGLHVGNCPGYPASHGCIRLPWSAARHYFAKCELGDLVIIQQ